MFIDDPPEYASPSLDRNPRAFNKVSRGGNNGAMPLHISWDGRRCMRKPPLVPNNLQRVDYPAPTANTGDFPCDSVPSPPPYSETLVYQQR